MNGPLHTDYSVQEYRPGLEKDIVDILIRGFGGWPKIDISCTPIDFWLWKYIDNPTGHVNLHVVMDGDRVICCDHGQPRRIKVGEKVRLGSCRGDLTVDREYRGRGVWVYSNEYATYTEIRDGFDFVYYLTGNETVVRRMSKIRPQFPHRLINWVLLRDVEKHLKHMPVEQEWLRKAGFTALKTLNNVMKKTGKNRLDIEINRIHSFGDDIEVFWEEVSPDFSFILERRKDYLNWRYADPRAGEHIIFAAYGEAKTLGYIVLRINRYIEEYPVGFIVDILTRTRETEIAEKLIGAAVDYFEEREINLVNCLMVKGSLYEKALRENGFLDSRLNIHMFYHPHGVEGEMKALSHTRADRVHFTWGDHDSLPLAALKT